MTISAKRDWIDLFIASILALFLELVCIRWFPAHVLFLTFFTNVMLLASFLGISVGCLAADRRRNYLAWTPAILMLALGVSYLIEWERHRGGAVRVGDIMSPQLVFFGVESQPWDASTFVVPIEVVSGVLFVLVSLVMVGPGQALGRSLARVSNRIESYTVNIVGSIAGILLFTACSKWELGPVWWFGGVFVGIAYLRRNTGYRSTGALLLGSASVLRLVACDAVPVPDPSAPVHELCSSSLCV